MSNNHPWPELLDPGALDWAVLEILWDKGALARPQVEAELAHRGAWVGAAADVVLSRLLELSLVRYQDRRRRPLHFVAAVSREELRGELFRRFLVRHFNGDIRSLLQCVQQDLDLASARARELKSMCEELGEKTSS